jgi:uroporphyrinogen-III decarboxylase
MNWCNGQTQTIQNGRKGYQKEHMTIKDNDHFVIGRMVVSHGPFQMACDLRSMENFMMDMAVNQNFAHALLEKVTETICGLVENYLRISAGSMGMIELPGDDYAANDNLVFSPTIVSRIGQALHKNDHCQNQRKFNLILKSCSILMGL